jgi:branched-chain amino acid transport system substrate-binding protein
MDPQAAPMMRQMRTLGMKTAFMGGDGMQSAEFIKLAGPAAEGLVCSQAGIPTQMASKAFLDGFKAKYGDVKQYAPFTYDGANLLIAAMQKADSADPAKYLPALASISYDGATGKIEFDAKGDRKDAEMTIFQLKGGKIEPVAIIKAGKTTKIDAAAPAAAPAAAAAPAMPAPAPATPAAPAPAPKK